MESRTVARQNYSMQLRAGGEKVVKVNEKTTTEGIGKKRERIT